MYWIGFDADSDSLGQLNLAAGDINLIVLIGPERATPILQAIRKALEERGIGGRRVVIATDFDALTHPARTELIVSVMVPVGRLEMERMPALKAIVSPLLGYDWIDVAEATRRGVAVANGEIPENRESMAEATIMLMLALLYRLHETEDALRKGNVNPISRHMARGRTIGIIGYGGITRAVLKRLAPWGCHYLIYSRGKPEVVDRVRFVDLETVMRESDVILVLTSLNTETRNLLGKAEFDLARRGTLLVNTARGGIIDEDALTEALETGRIGAAALDVFAHEPLPLDHPFRSLPNVILTPHSIGHTEAAREAGPINAAVNIAMFLAGDVPESCKNPEVLA